MKRARRALLKMAVVVGCGATLAGCRDSGLPGKNLPLQQARHREFRYPAYQRSPENVPVAAVGYHWIPGPPPETIPERLLTPVGAAGGQTLYAPRGQQAPHSRLYARASDGRWRPYVRLN
jgi:hypothetical protein